MKKKNKFRYANNVRSGKFIPLENVLNIYDQNRLWFYIPGFNGYEVSNDGYIRSMKHFRKYPFGIMIKPKDKIRNQDPSYELSDNNNERVTIRLSQIMYLAKVNPYGVSGYPRNTMMSDTQSRNMRAFVKKQLKVPPLDNTPRFPKFTVVASQNDMIDMYKAEDYKVPITDMDGVIYYGRKDCRTVFN
jgi:hypothetical protein